MMKKVNSTMVARAAGVSQATVSRVLNNHPRVDERTRRAVLSAASSLGYSLRIRGGNLRIGIVMSKNSPIGSYQAMTLSALKADVYRRSWQMEIVFNEDLAVLGSRALSGAISISGDGSLNRRWSEFTTLPLVRFAARSSHSDNIYSVYSDEEPLWREMLKMLYASGHRRIGLLLRRSRASDAVLYENLGELFPRLMTGFGMAGAEEFVSYGGSSVPLAERLENLLRKGVTALIVIPGDTALEVCALLRARAIRIPDDLSLVTRDFSGVTEFWNPPLTVMRTDYNALSVSALDLLARLVRGERPSADVAIPGKLICRESVRGL